MKIFSQWYATDIGKCLRKATAAVWQKTANTTRKPSKTAWHVSSPQAYARMDTQKQPYLPVTRTLHRHRPYGRTDKDIFVRACLLEYVLGAFISISGRGVKLFIRIDIDGVNDYPAIYEATAKLVSTVLGVEKTRNARISPIPASDHTTRTHTTTVTQRPSTTFCRTVHSLRASPTLPSLPLPAPPALPPLSPTDIRLRCRVTGFPPLPSYSPTSPSTLPQRATGTEPFSGSAALPANAASTVTN